VYLGGLGGLKAQGARWFRSGKISVRVGAPIEFKPGLEPGQATALLEDAVRRLGQRIAV
jgi:hypothetical protein